MANEIRITAGAAALMLAMTLPLGASAADGATRSMPSATAPSSGGARASGGTDDGFGDRKDNQANGRAGSRPDNPTGGNTAGMTAAPARERARAGDGSCPGLASALSAGSAAGSAAGAIDATGKAGQPAQPERVSTADETAMRGLAQVHLYEAKLSGLAEAVSQDPRVRGYAAKMLEDHLTALDGLRGVAERAGVVLPGGVESEQAGVLHALALKSGADFDAAYWNAAGAALQQQEVAYAGKVAQTAALPALKCAALAQGDRADRHLLLAQQMTGSPQQASAALAATRMAGQSVSPAAPAETPSNRSADSGGTPGASSLAGSAVHGQTPR